MTDLTFKINNVDFSSIVDRWEYSTDLIPVTLTRTDLNKVDHTIVVRHRGVCSVKLNPISPDQAKSLFDELTDAPCLVDYFSFQEKTSVQRTMIPKFDMLQDAAKRSSGHWVRSITVTFTEE